MKPLLSVIVTAGHLISFALIGVADAQSIAPDGTLPTRVTSPNGRNFTITGGRQAGGNLFHSFSQFSVPTSGSADFSFDSAAGIQNIISRVTGGSVSTIDGAINSTSPVNLFLINPSGIIFGPQASLNIGGSFIGSTANSLRFADGTEFRASSAQSAPLLTMSVPVGLQYSGENAPIQLQGAVLSVSPNQTLALVGGEVVMSGGELRAPGGRIELGGVRSGSVGLNFAEGQWQLAYPNPFDRSNVALTDSAFVTTSGEGGGKIQLVGQQLAIRDARVEANTFGSVPRGSLTLNASDSVTVTSRSTSGEFAQGLFAENYGEAAAGGLTVTANRLLVQGEARLSTSTFGTGRGGDLTIDAAHSTALIGTRTSDPSRFTGLTSDTYQSGMGGDITINTGRLSVRNGAQITAVANGSANAGTLTVNAARSIALVGVSPSDFVTSGLFTAVAENAEATRAGDVLINTGRLSVRNGAQIFAGTGAAANGGNVVINAADSVDVIGVSPIARTPGGIYSATNPNSTGRAGNLTINTRRLSVRDGGSVATAVTGLGQGGTLVINASDSVHVNGQGPPQRDPLNPDQQIPTFSTLSASVYNPANTRSSGDITINTERLTTQGGARINVDNEGKGRGGSIRIQAQSVFLNGLGGDPSNPGGIRAVTASGEGGNIALQLRDLLLMQNGSLVSTDASGGSGNGGDINIETAILSAFNNSDITADAVQGRGGNIQIDAQGILGAQFRPALTPESDITASSRFGASGVVEIRTPEVDPTRGAVVLPIQPIDATQLVAQGCQSNPDRETSRFTITGRGGLPANPEAVLRSDAVMQDLRTVPLQVSRDLASILIVQSMPNQPPSEPIEAQGLIETSQGEILLAAQVSSATPSSPWFAALSCNGH